MKHLGTHTAYITGFIISIALTLAAYLLISQHVASGHQFFPHSLVVPAISVLAVVQLIVQLLLFLHLGNEPKPRLNLLIAIFSAMVVATIVFGSVWIMDNLNYNMAPTGIDERIMHDEGIHK